MMALQPGPVLHGRRHSEHVDSEWQLVCPCHITHLSREGSRALRHDVTLLEPQIQSEVESALTTGRREACTRQDIRTHWAVGLVRCGGEQS